MCRKAHNTWVSNPMSHSLQSKCYFTYKSGQNTECYQHLRTFIPLAVPSIPSILLILIPNSTLHFCPPLKYTHKWACTAWTLPCGSFSSILWFWYSSVLLHVMAHFPPSMHEYTLTHLSTPLLTDIRLLPKWLFQTILLWIVCNMTPDAHGDLGQKR